MRIDWWTLGLQTVNGLVLVWLLARFLFRPVAAMVATRQAEAARMLSEAADARAAAEAERDKAVEANANLARDRADALQAAAAEADTEKAAILTAAREEAERSRDAALKDAERTRRDEAAKADVRASQLAVDIAAKVLCRLPDAARVAGFIDGLAEAVAALPEATRSGIGRVVHLRAARALTQTEIDDCRVALTRVLGSDIEIVLVVDPGLIAGLELDTPHAVVRDSFRADLDRIATALTTHDAAGS
jgi:F-type H+-transporting ATPase subunit b